MSVILLHRCKRIRLGKGVWIHRHCCLHWNHPDLMHPSRHISLFSPPPSISIPCTSLPALVGLPRSAGTWGKALAFPYVHQHHKALYSCFASASTGGMRVDMLPCQYMREGQCAHHLLYMCTIQLLVAKPMDFSVMEGDVKFDLWCFIVTPAVLIAIPSSVHYLNTLLAKGEAACSQGTFWDAGLPVGDVSILAYRTVQTNTIQIPKLSIYL